MQARQWELTLLKTLLWSYIALCLIIASLNWGYVPSASPKVATAITKLWHFYENWIKTILIVVCGILTLRIRKRKASIAMRKKNMVGFALAALLVHIALPILLKNPELYYFAMPLPWSTIPLQVQVEGTAIQKGLMQSIGLQGIKLSLVFFWLYSGFILVGTLLFGRRLQCSSLCLFNGFASEIFEPAFPLLGKKKAPLGKHGLRSISVVRTLFFILSLAFTSYWILQSIGVGLSGNREGFSSLETYKYLIFELLMAMFFWVAFIGRMYCYYCPVGTLLSWIAKVGGQRIITDKTHCIQCGKCNATCQLSIDIQSCAKEKGPVISSYCVGCGHCVDVCPAKTLGYCTNFTHFFHIISCKYKHKGKLTRMPETKH
ncbi:4Fe-4S dicluster domain-containing protein [Sphaerochaeta sp. PS]|uniref:4Fe-4S binding protein n=1 Tax=Sphaerochaeta sp. PS TaxID=3076336 RepID=UPI0028A4FA6E|nr:4Fe-4S binding protein [Sphaerochaeta sp. PS]MDT4762093.1 4Fe-4S binding protein [Sphaerochaeta sp. PS]